MNGICAQRSCPMPMVSRGRVERSSPQDEGRTAAADLKNTTLEAKIQPRAHRIIRGCDQGDTRIRMKAKAPGTTSKYVLVHTSAIVGRFVSQSVGLSVPNGARHLVLSGTIITQNAGTVLRAGYVSLVFAERRTQWETWRAGAISGGHVDSGICTHLYASAPCIKDNQYTLQIVEQTCAAAAGLLHREQAQETIVWSSLYPGGCDFIDFGGGLISLRQKSTI